MKFFSEPILPGQRRILPSENGENTENTLNHNLKGVFDTNWRVGMLFKACFDDPKFYKF